MTDTDTETTPTRQPCHVHIANALSEHAPGPRTQLRALIHTLGDDLARALLDEVHQIEAAGGMLTKDGSRRRTPGGVFFFIAYRHLTPEQQQTHYHTGYRAPTTYIVYISTKQWAKVRDALANPNDTAIIEGIPMYDQEYEAMTVFTTSITTKLTQQARRESQKAQGQGQTQQPNEDESDPSLVQPPNDTIGQHPEHTDTPPPVVS